MKTRIVRIGNSQGVRIPKSLLEQTGLADEVELEVRDSTIIIKPAGRPRVGWDDAFSKMAEHSDDELLDPAIADSEWDNSEWTW
jgi:antitoxin MazE